MVAIIAVSLGVFTHLGTYTPWSPHMDAWSSDPVPVHYLQNRTPLRAPGRGRLPGQAVPQLPCLGGVGGQRGPALDSVATRMTKDQMMRQVLQGGGNMPAYGKNLSPAEVDGAGQLP